MATSYAIHSTVRARHNRTLRASQPTRHRFKQYIGDRQQRLVRTRPVLMQEDEFLRALPEIKAKAALGILEVRTQGGQLVNLDTLQPMEPAAPPPLVNPPEDSIARDTPWGQSIPTFPGDQTAAVGEERKEPSLLSDLESIDEEPEETIVDDPEGDEPRDEPAPDQTEESPATSPTEPSPRHSSKGGRKSRR